jgi:adenylosuccinate lyase
MTCNFCGKDKDISQFYFLKDKQVYRKKCKECIREKANKYNKQKYERESNTYNVYRNYLKQFKQANDLKEKQHIRKALYQEPLTEIMLDRVWEKIIEKSMQQV